jgi:hypothetical protein
MSKIRPTDDEAHTNGTALRRKDICHLSATKLTISCDSDRVLAGVASHR